LEIGGTRPDIETIHLGDVLDEIERELRERAVCKGLAFHMRRPSPQAVWVRSDRILLKRALFQPGQQRHQIHERGGVLVGAVGLKSCVRLDVWDTGVGIPAEFQQRIFDEYFQVGDPCGGAKRGLGLGLAIVRRIERNLPGHRLRFASKPGRGSRFSLSMPGDAAPCLAPWPRRPGRRTWIGDWKANTS